jgi:hypothetical protein
MFKCSTVTGDRQRDDSGKVKSNLKSASCNEPQTCGSSSLQILCKYQYYSMLNDL